MILVQCESGPGAQLSTFFAPNLPRTDLLAWSLILILDSFLDPDPVWGRWGLTRSLRSFNWSPSPLPTLPSPPCLRLKLCVFIPSQDDHQDSVPWDRLKHLDLAGTPLRCSCDISWMLRFAFFASSVSYIFFHQIILVMLNTFFLQIILVMLVHG